MLPGERVPPIFSAKGNQADLGGLGHSPAVMIRLLILLFLVIALDVYGYFVLRSVFPHRLSGWRNGFAYLWWAVPTLAVVMLLLNATGAAAKLPKALVTLLGAGLFILYFAKFCGAVIFLLDDLRRLLFGAFRKLSNAGTVAFWPDRSKFLTQLGILAGALPVATLSYGIIRNGYRYELHTVDVPISGLSPKHEGLRIVQISDIHSGSFYRRSPIADGIRLINDQGADLVCFTGDLVNAQATEIEPYIDIFSKIESRLGTFSTIGNHDYGDYVADWGPAEKEANWQRLYRNHRELGWDLLLNENRILDIDGEPLALVGTENWSNIARFPKTGDLDKALRGTAGVLTKVLLSHDPTHWDAKVAPYRPDIQLQLAGHTHGFQFGVEIPGFRWSPSQYVYEQWAGLYSRGNQHLYVNRGFGFLGYPGRVGILPEVTLLRLVAA